jgi:hypothetical protein
MSLPDTILFPSADWIYRNYQRRPWKRTELQTEGSLNYSLDDCPLATLIEID